MPYMIVAAAIAAAASLIGAAIAAGDTAKAIAIREDIARRVGAIKLPVLDKLVASKLPPEAAARYLESTKSTQTQSDVLDKTMDVVNEKGETVSDRAAYLRMQNEAANIAHSSGAGIQREMGNRGLAGSGMAYALQQQGAQSAINRANASGLQEAADARNRYMQALGMAGNMSTEMRGQELTAMKAQDEINMFNARQQSDADLYNASLSQRNFDNEMQRAIAEANARNGVASSYDASANATRQTGSGIGNSVITGAAAYDQYGNPIKKPGYSSSAGGT